MNQEKFFKKSQLVSNLISFETNLNKNSFEENLEENSKLIFKQNDKNLLKRTRKLINNQLFR